ncbi:hypothetical protein FQ154_09810 [Paeniglutamicibacter gangotriensis]|uniref:Uncharacterized protein n=1 Tax=Paeniglutamicibacter gangotriensis TaxID=254787 RepID=A0A5B0EH85_9MICC|nr:hypothetical protein [Paeniglutamicibacter gangotriensis]KAA0977181.1 hypothetical protein FQ154_09810 [Paeniglutamicibacter gangotriensis]
MGTLDPDKYQALLNAHDELDDVPVRMTRHQAQKCAAILTAGQDGHATYAEATLTVAEYLQALALDELPGISRTDTDSATLWQILEDLPWPAPGPPAVQPS